MPHSPFTKSNRRHITEPARGSGYFVTAGPLTDPTDFGRAVKSVANLATAGGFPFFRVTFDEIKLAAADITVTVYSPDELASPAIGSPVVGNLIDDGGATFDAASQIDLFVKDLNDLSVTAAGFRVSIHIDYDRSA